MASAKGFDRQFSVLEFWLVYNLDKAIILRVMTFGVYNVSKDNGF